MLKNWPIILLLAAFAAGCGYPDLERPIVHDYSKDLYEIWWKAKRPGEPTEERPSKKALAAAFARWQESVGGQREDYRVGPGDVLNVTILVPPELKEEATFDVAVARAGQLDCPLVGTVPVTGLSTFEIGRKLTRLYAAGYYQNPTVIVRVAEFGSKRVAVTGAVTAPGVVTLQTNRSTVMEVLLAAGGLSENAGRQAVIIRADEDRPDGGPQRLEVNLERLLDRAVSVENLTVQPGDVLHVPPAPHEVFYVMGYVGRTGAFPLPRNADIGVLDAVNIAGGVRWDGRPEYTYLIRETPDGPKQYSIDLTKVASTKRGDIPVRPNDRIIVSTTMPIRAYSGLTRLLGLRSFIPIPAPAAQ